MNEEMTLKQLFAAADEIGDKYLTTAEIEERDRELLKVRTEIWNSLTDEDLDSI